MSIGQASNPDDGQPADERGPSAAGDLDVERGSDVPISTQIYWQIAYQIDSGRLLPGARLAPVRELGAALRVNPNTIRAVYRRLADAGYVTSRHGAGTHVADRPPERRGAEALAGIISEMLRRAAHAGFTPDEVAAATYAAATERKRPGDKVQVLFAECTTADAGYDAKRLVHGRVPLVAMLVGPGYVELVHEIAGLPAGSRVGLVCASERGAENMAETLALSGTTGIQLLNASMDGDGDLTLIDRTADVILLSREAIANGLAARFERPERIRQWSYEFDPSGLEFLRRAVEHVIAARRSEAVPAGA